MDPGFFQLLDPDPGKNPGSGSRSHKFVRNCSFSSKILTNSMVKTRVSDPPYFEADPDPDPDPT